MVGRLAAGQAEEELLEARGLGHERGERDPRLAERDGQRRDGLVGAGEAQLAVAQLDVVDARLGEERGPRPLRLERAEPVAARGRREQVAELALVDDRALADDRDAVAEVLDLGRGDGSRAGS